MTKRSLAVAALFLAGSSLTFAQQQKFDFKSIDVEDALSPEYSIGVGPQKKATSQKWMWIEASFIYQVAGNKPVPIDDLKLTYYILLDNKSAENPKGTLLTGSVTHTGVMPGGPSDVKHSVMLISPQVLKRFFGGKIPANMKSACQAVGVTASVKGQVVKQMSIGLGKGKDNWWSNFQQGPQGMVLSKDQTPFAPLFYDYFEATKSESGGGF